MPTYRSITTTLVSQFDILVIPEYEPPKTPIDPFLNAPTLINYDHSLVSVYIPTYPSSQFWLSYSISPPYPPKMLYYFKLYIDGRHVVSWGCGEEDGYEGKTMFGLFDAGPTNSKHPQIERRVLCFGAEHGHGLTSNYLNDFVEVKVFRSKGRKRIAPRLEDYQSLSGKADADRNKSQLHSSGNGINLVNAGLLPARHPRRYYKYALLDPLDHPFATFRYYYRSWDQLEALGVISPTPSTETSSIQSNSHLKRPLSPKSTSDTTESYVSVSSHLNSNPANTSTDTVTRSTNEDSQSDVTAAEENSISGTTETARTPASPDHDFSSPLRAKLISIPPLLRPLPRPQTPPPSATPPQPTQLPPIIPPTLPPTAPTPTTLSTKESFASLIRNRFPSPDRSAFQLHELVAEPNPPASSLGARSSSVGALLGVVSSARNRRRRGGEEGQVGRLQEVTGKSGDGSGVRGDEERAQGRGRRVERGREKCRY